MKSHTFGGGFSLQNGAGKSLGCSVRPLSNMYDTSMDTSSVVKITRLSYQDISATIENIVQYLTSRWVVGWIGKLRAFECQFLPMTEWANPSKSKLFDVVTCPKTTLAELSHLLDQRLQARCQFRFLLLIINQRWKEMLVRPLGFDVYVNKEPFLGRAFLSALECGIQIFIPAAVAHR
jgi:hypothetical protein